jgi:penicillin-binding protein 1A
MYEEGYINKTDYTTAVEAPLNASYHDLPTEVKAPYVAELTRQQLEQMYGDSIYTDGFKVYTTINSSLQDNANNALRTNLLAYDQRHGYRGATSNLGIPSLDSMENWEKSLRKIPTVNGLEPAAVVEMTDKTVSVLRANGDLTIIPWQGLSWARKQINADYLGGMPRSAAQIVKLGDVVYINQTANGVQLAQVPKAEASIVTLNPQNGAILALVGGFDFQTSKFNRATNAQRQPGSSFKPFVYAAALDKGWTLASVINDAPIVIEQNDNTIWRPQNDEHKFYGPTRLRTAIIKSRNLVSIRLLSMIGLPYTIEYVKRFGFVPQQLPPGLSLALGTATVTPLQMAQAYSVFANGGMKVVPFIIDSIKNSQDEVIYQAKPLEVCNEGCKKDAAIAPRMISEQTAFLMTSAMQDVIERGTAKLAKQLNRNDLAGKTGTTQNQVDAWFCGYNPDYVTVAWVGFDFNQSLHEFGAQAALPMWMDFMHASLKDKPERILPEPPGIVSVRVDPLTGNRTSANDPNGIFEYFVASTAPAKGRESATPPAETDETSTPQSTQENDGAPADTNTQHDENANTESNDTDKSTPAPESTTPDSTVAPQDETPHPDKPSDTLDEQSQ